MTLLSELDCPDVASTNPRLSSLIGRETRAVIARVDRRAPGHERHVPPTRGPVIREVAQAWVPGLVLRKQGGSAAGVTEEVIVQRSNRAHAIRGGGTWRVEGQDRVLQCQSAAGQQGRPAPIQAMVLLVTIPVPT